jgi:hypothetical protein
MSINLLVPNAMLVTSANVGAPATSDSAAPATSDSAAAVKCTGDPIIAVYRVVDSTELAYLQSHGN